MQVADFGCKIADFGLAQLVKTDAQQSQGTNQVDSTLYNRFTTKSDMWSFGIVLYEIITYGRFPYPGMINKQALECVLQGYRIPQPFGCPSTIILITLRLSVGENIQQVNSLLRACSGNLKKIW